MKTTIHGIGALAAATLALTLTANQSAWSQDIKPSEGQALQTVHKFALASGLTTRTASVSPISDLSLKEARDYRLSKDGTSVLEYTNHDALALTASTARAWLLVDSSITAKSDAIIRANGLDGQVKFSELKHDKIGGPGREEYTALAFYKRVYSGFEYRDDHACVVINPATGDLLMYVSKLDSPLPKQAIVSLTNSDAITRTKMLLNYYGVGSWNTITTKLQILQPNSYWINGIVDSANGTSVLAWDVVVKNKDITHEVWVDAATGQVVGGQEFGVLGSGWQEKSVMHHLKANTHAN